VSSIFLSTVSIGTPVFATPYNNIKDAAWRRITMTRAFQHLL
jgi:hypothetical protein